MWQSESPPLRGCGLPRVCLAHMSAGAGCGATGARGIAERSNYALDTQRNCAMAGIDMRVAAVSHRFGRAGAGQQCIACATVTQQVADASVFWNRRWVRLPKTVVVSCETRR
jgi:hypothetical protein